MKKYNKVTDMQVLKKYDELYSAYYSSGIWVDYIPIDCMANILNTSKYQVQKAYKNLREQGYMKMQKVPSYCEEYDNGLYTQDIPILYSKVYIITEKGAEKAKESDFKEETTKRNFGNKR